MIVRLRDVDLDTTRIGGWYGWALRRLMQVARWLILRAPDHADAVIKLDPASDPRAGELPSVISKLFAMPEPPRYTTDEAAHVEAKPVATPEPLPMLGMQEKRAGRYAYRSRRRFASPDGDEFEPLPKGSVADPIMSKSRR